MDNENPQLGLTLECAQECKRDMREAIARSSVGAAIEPVTVHTLTGLPAVEPAIPSQPRTKPKPVKPLKTKADKLTFLAKEYKVVCLRECPTAVSVETLNGPEQIAEYCKAHILTHPYFDPEVECFVVLLLNTRRKIKGHVFVSKGTMDTILVHPREVFRAAIIAAAAAIILVHNHPSGDPSPSEPDIKVTRDLIRAGQLIKIEVLDHVIMGHKTDERAKDYASLRELGYFYNNS